MTEYPVKFEDCAGIGGHCFETTGGMLVTYPPQYLEVCKHCGARRTASSQPAFVYSEPVPAHPVGLQEEKK